MYQTIQVSSCLSIQGEFVEALANGDVVVRDGGNIYRGQPVKRLRTVIAATLVHALDGRATPAHESA